MAHQSAFTADEISEMIKSEDLEKQTVAARNLWAFWNGWQEALGGVSEEEVRKTFSDLAPIIHELLKQELEETMGQEGEMPRHIWHFLLSLGCLQYQPAMKTITDILQDTAVTENIRAFAADALTRFPPVAIDEEIENILWKLSTTDDSLPVRVNCIRAIGSKYKESHNNSIAAKLWEMVKNTELHNAVISTVISTIGEVGAMNIVPDLVHMMITRRTPGTKKDAAMALDRIAELNGMSNRNDLIKSIEDIEV